MEQITQLYQHVRLDTEEVFYFGIGIGDRPWQKRGRNDHWNKVVNKAGCRVEILEEGLSWYQACELEKMLIALYGRQDLGTGPLVNKTDGGDGTLGHKHSPESLVKMSDRNKGERNPMYGKPGSRKGKTHSPDHRAKLSASLMGRPGTMKGKTQSQETIVKRCATRLKNKLAKLEAQNK